MTAPDLGTGASGMKRPALAYLRVSTERQATEDRTSLGDQRAVLERLADQLGAVVRHWHIDPGASGATAERRPGFRALLAACEADPQPRGAPGYVLVLNASRFGRWEDPEEAAYWRHHLRRHGWLVRYAEGDAEGDAAPIVRAVASLEASTYRRNLIANTRRGMRGAAQQGFWCREAPFGYRREVVLPASARRVLERGQLKTAAEKVKLAPHPEEAAVVRWIYEAYAAGGVSLGTIAAELRRCAPGRRWGRTVVQHLIRSHAYRGAVIGGRRRDGEGEAYGCEGAHEPLVPAALWQAAQRRLERNAQLGAAVRTDYLLSGLLICPHCGCRYSGGGGGRQGSRTRTCRRFYRDGGGVGGVCPGRIGTVMRHLVDDAAVALVAETVRTPAFRRQIERGVDATVARAAAGPSAAGLRAARARLEANRDRLVAAVASGAVLPAEAGAQLAHLREEVAGVTAQLEALRFARRRAEGARSERDRVLDLVVNLPELLERATPPERRDLMEPWLGSATFDKVTRVLALGLRRVPAACWESSNWAGPTDQSPVGLVVRSTSLVQPGHEYRIAEAAAAVRRGRTA